MTAATNIPSLATNGESSAGATSSFAWLLGMLLALVAVLHFGGQRVAHTEGDEVVFTFLAERLIEHPTRYNVQGELTGPSARRFVHDVIEAQYKRPFPQLQTIAMIMSPPDASGRRRPLFEPAIYDRPLFFHPPLYPCSLAVSRAALGSGFGVYLSAIFHLLTICITAQLGRLLMNPAAGLLAAALVAIEAVSWTCGERLWVDGMLEMTVALAALAGVWSVQRGGVGRFALAGGCLALAGLTKLPAGLLAPAVVVLWLSSKRRPSWAEMAVYAGVCGMLVVPWLLTTHHYLGTFVPADHPTEWMKANSPWVRLVLQRNALYYLVGLLLVSPVLLYVLPALPELRHERRMWFPAAWAACLVGGLALIGATGMGYQLRYLAPAMPALCLLAAGGTLALRTTWRWPLLALAVYTLMVAVNTGLSPGTVDPKPDALASFGKDLFDWDLLTGIPGMW